jgi:hypothetical protein
MEKLMVWNSVSWGDQNLEAQMLEHVCINIVATAVGASDVTPTGISLPYNDGRHPHLDLLTIRTSRY